jgi:hypothetical protein
MHPIEQWQPRADASVAWPAANPVLTCAHVVDKPSSFVADPFLWPSADGQGPWYLFYETKTVSNNQVRGMGSTKNRRELHLQAVGMRVLQGDIGAAVSHDQGHSWQHAGVVLDEAWHLSYPFVFAHEGKVSTHRACHTLQLLSCVFVDGARRCT